jgi:hypothetical protein
MSYLADTCPICNNKLLIQSGKVTGFDFVKKFCNFNTTFHVKTILSATCFHPIQNDPLHYYGHYSDAANPDTILADEMSIDIGRRNVLFANVYCQDNSLIWSKKDSKPLELPFIINPDYPDLKNLKKRIKLSITFG